NAKGTYYATQKWNLVSVNTYSGQSFGFTYEQAPVKHLENITEAFYQGHLEVLNFTDSTVIYDPLNIKEIYWEGVKSHIKSITYPNGTYVNFVIHNDTSITNLSRVDQPGDWILDKIEI